jgi:hypothetical protein
MVNLQVYAPPTSKPPQNIAKEKMANLPIVMPYVNPFIQPYINKYIENQPPPAYIYKDYNINIGGIGNGNHATINKIYEDIMPPLDIYASYKTLRERTGLNYHIKGAFVKEYEGEMINFTGGVNNLCERLKLVKQSPNSSNYFSLNPYASTPKNMLIYGSSYPIKFNRTTLLTTKTENSTELIVRVYGLTKEEIEILYQNSSTAPTKKLKDFDIFREREYYFYIFDKLGKTNISPNFIYPYCWFTNEDAMTNYETNIYQGDSNCKNKQYTFCKSIIILTEAPTYNIFAWASNIYEPKNIVMEQKNTGYKTPETWKSILFQMVIVFYTMVKLNFVFNEMKLEKNFYVKTYGTTHEKNYFNVYKIDGVEFYVPTFSYLLMFDTDFHDIKNTPQLIAPNKKPMPIVNASILPPTTIPDYDKYKLLMKNYNDNEKIIYKKICENATEIFNRDNFNGVFKTKFKGVEPDTETLNLFNNIGIEFSNIKNTLSTQQDVLDKIFNDILLKHFNGYLNNRINTQVKDSEKTHLITTPVFNRGDLIAMPDGDYCKIQMAINDHEYYNTESNKNEIIHPESQKFISNNSIYQNNGNEMYANFNYLGETYDYSKLN